MTIVTHQQHDKDNSQRRIQALLDIACVWLKLHCFEKRTFSGGKDMEDILVHSIFGNPLLTVQNSLTLCSLLLQ